MSIDPNSTDFRFGQILERLNSGESNFKEIKEKLAELHACSINTGNTLARLELRSVMKVDCEVCKDERDSQINSLKADCEVSKAELDVQINSLNLSRAKLVGIAIGITSASALTGGTVAATILKVLGG